ncbi:MAG TPA: PAS domain-containing protein [Rhizomicrobium sp.]|nr:PAS domain-containing protein [Rhizomicrobium sp.]
MSGGDHGDPVLTAMPPGKGRDRARTGIAIEDLKHPIVCEAYRVWNGLRGDTAMPARAAMTPKAMRGFLKYLALVEVLDGGREFRFRVSGDVVNVQQGMPLQGMTTADIDKRAPGYGANLNRLYARVFRRRVPHAYRGTYYRPTDGHAFSHESVMLPLSDDAETVDHVLIVAA